MAGSRDGERSSSGSPGWGAALLAVPFLVLLAGIRYEWWRHSSSVQVLFELAVVWFALFGLVGVGAVWVIRCYRFWRRERRIGWAMGLGPLVVVVAAVVFVVVPKPAERAFDRARVDMEKFAVSMLHDQRERVGPTEIGGLAFTTVYVEDDRCVYFVDGVRSSSISRVGWLYTAECTPNPNGFARLDPVDTDWTVFEQGS